MVIRIVGDVFSPVVRAGTAAAMVALPPLVPVRVIQVVCAVAVRVLIPIILFVSRFV